jgi:NAD+ diphosphatase
MRYPTAVDLPFNYEAIRKGFVPARPGGEPPAGQGWWLLLQGNDLVVEGAAADFGLPRGELPAWAGLSGEPLWIGSWQGEPLRVAMLARETAIPAPYRAESFNAVDETLDDALLTLGGMGKQVLHWERQSRHCSRCGGELGRLPAGWGKRCMACRVEHYPHIHPCVIVLVRRGDEFLLARKAEWPAGRYSLVAGFVDFGEALEECVHREVLEETGIRVSNLRYVGSQNWPFPSQLMAGFVADYAGGELTIDTTELEDARWFCSTDLPRTLPTRRSIARWIIDRFALAEP